MKIKGNRSKLILGTLAVATILGKLGLVDPTLLQGLWEQYQGVILPTLGYTAVEHFETK